ncbi:peptide-methionine (S)-S-oxide reductase MsrA [Bdellovibrio sp. 22V]|uniref:peptide-methionine (S)-S-oxide reductase MsrA n=1 Tax=Bdellovibrio TaxID=958 RepID=UPI002543AA3F|nr:peptide-methionine (S)-S-oxide reductase MsrA [Bdellovibrio sp. 22V]WII71243.1 peptide-methionine (S)-S-oxide reductase MsrA [Bdellovibrio sp. 22V]
MKRLFSWLFAFIVMASLSSHAKSVKKKGSSMNTKTEIAYLAGGCFWGMEDLLRKIPGVVGTEVGYMGGDTPNANYNIVKTGTTNHAESVKITFDPSKLSYEELLVHFFKIHDPTTSNRQGNDVGTQYRSAIFYTTPQQKEDAERMIVRVDKSGAWKKPVVTQVVKAGEFWKAEEFHQDYLQKNPGGYTCHYERNLQF